MVKNYPYLNDINFLNKIYGQHNKTTYVNITLLDWFERPIQEIQGKVISGSISVNGDSAVRRTANLSIFIKDYDELYTNINGLFSINKKIFIETGIRNGFRHRGEYNDYPIIWFPFGVFITQNYSINRDVNGITLNLSLGDKMCLLNGDAGGTIPASTNFESIDTVGPDGDLHSEYVKINQLISELVHHFGGEDLNKIIINDVPNKIKQCLKWRGTNTLYLTRDTSQGGDNYKYTTMDTTQENWSSQTIPYNYDAGYTYTDFVYPGELVGAPGDSVCTILDKIKNTLGNYEYFYDIFGNFVFQEIQNYINTSEYRQGTMEYFTDPTNAYLPSYTKGHDLSSTVYDFSTDDFVISYNNNPKFNMIKNDFIVWGIRKTSTGIQLPCRYHLAIDERPKIVQESHYYIRQRICFDTSMYDKVRKAHMIKQDFLTFELPPGGQSSQSLKATVPEGTVGDYYYVHGTGQYDSQRGVYTWVTDVDKYEKMLKAYKDSGGTSTEVISTDDSEEKPTEVVAGYIKLPYAYCRHTPLPIPGGNPETDTYFFKLKDNTDWRNILYFNGLINSSTQGTDAGYYWTELCNEWPKVYNVQDDCFYQDVLDCPTGLDWWLDFVDNDVLLNKFSVNNIGRRSYAKAESECNCVFEPTIPDIIMVDVSDAQGMVDTRTQKTQQELKELGLIPVQVNPAIYSSLAAGGTYNSCYQNIRQLITNYTDYNENINVTCLPIYHLEPNTRVSFNDPKSGISGDYLINSISFNLGNTGVMNISAKKCIEKI